MKYAIVIPARNEEARIRGTVEDYVSFARSALAAEGAEIIIVVNGSRDATGSVARRLADEHPAVRAVETPERLGKGGAVYRGFDHSHAEILSFVDADNSTPPVELNKLLQTVAGGASAAIGSRWLAGSRQEIPQPLPRRVAGRAFNQLVRRLFGLPFRDTQCGAKAFARKAYTDVRASLELSGWAFDVEMLVRLRDAGHRVEEVPIVWRDISDSRLRIHRDGPAMLWELAQLLRRTGR